MSILFMVSIHCTHTPHIFFFLMCIFTYLAVLGLCCSMWTHVETYVILVPPPEIEPRPCALEVQSLSHCITMQVPTPHLLFPFIYWWICGLFLCLQFSSVAQSCPTLCDPMNRSMPGLPVHHQLTEPTQTHVHWVGDTIQPSHPLSSSSPPALTLCQHQGLFKWVSSSHQVAKGLEFQLQHHSFQCNTQDWSPLGWTGWISLQSKGLSKVFSNNTVQKQQFFSAQLSSQSNSHIHTWPLEKP